MMGALAGLAARRPWRVVLLSVLFAAVAVVVGVPGLADLSGEGFDDPGSEAVHARELIQRATGAEATPGLIALVRPGSSVLAGPGRREVESVARRLAASTDVAGVETPYASPAAARALTSSDGRAAALAVTLHDDDRVNGVIRNIRDPEVTFGGGAVANREVNDIVGEDLTRAELFAFPILFLLSLWVFRGVVAALLPPMIGGLVILGAFLGLSLINHATAISVYAINLGIGLGLGLAIDYSLLIVSRYREEVAVDGLGVGALRRTLATAGRSVVFSALTVGGALAALLVFPLGFLRSMAIAGLLVATLAAVAAILVLPAVLTLLGPRVNALAPARWRRASETPGRRGGWYRFSQWVMRHPGPIALVTATALITAGIPALGIRFTTVDARVLPTSAQARQVSDALERDFPQDTSSPILVAVAAPQSAAPHIRAYSARLAALPGVAAVAPPQALPRGVWRIEIVSAERPLTDASQSLVRRIRAVRAPAPALVGGLTAGFIDQKAALADRLPLAIAIVALVTILALWLLTGSVVLPVKAVIMNFLTLSAVFGIMVVVFQDGHLEGPLAFTGLGGIDTTQPILLAALAFGLSTDYAVFLLSRITEFHLRGAGDREAVAAGLERTGRIITAAALLFCVAVGAFATSRIVILKELGVGTALAVLIDATIIRALLVPSLMALLGQWNWWSPAPLRRLHGRIGVSEA